MSFTVDAHLRRRRAINSLMLSLMVLATGIAIAILVAVLGYVIFQGGTSLNVDFMTQTPRPVGQTGGGVGNAIVGSLIIVGMACLVGLPVGIGSGVYLAEFGRTGRLGTLIRFTTDVLTGVPSITIGLFAYTLIVLPMHGFSAIAGALSLAVIMLPIVTRTTESMLLLVPDNLREGALALGVPRWKVTLRIALPTAIAGIITGAMLAIARAAGETAPLLFTSFGNTFWNLDPTQPTAALPLQIFTYAIAPYDDWHRQAWAGALVLVALVLILSTAARFLSARWGPTAAR